MTIPKEYIPKIPPTENQLALIKNMEEVVRHHFDGSTKAEASEWIDRNIDMYKVLTLTEWQTSYM